MILFGRSGDGSADIARLTGTFSAYNDFSTIESELNFATLEVEGIAGRNVVAAAEKEYGEGTPTPLVDAVRLPIAILAVARHSALNLVSHDDTGRKVKADDNEKMPWEWMIDRDDRAQLDRFYRAMDALFAYLERERPELAAPGNECIVKSIRDFENVYPIDHSLYVFHRMTPLMIEVQRTKLMKRVGADKWAVITGPGPLSDADAMLLWHCERFAILSALVLAVRRWSLSVFPLEIARRFAPSYQGNKSSRVATVEEIDRFVNAMRGEIDDIANDIIETLTGENPAASADFIPSGNPKDKFFSAQ